MSEETPLHCLVEIPKGSRNKYEWDEELQAIRFDRFLFSSVVYPLDYGMIPETLAEDGDPLDAMVCVSEPTFPGCVVEARPVARLGLRDQAGEDAKILVVPADDPRFTAVRDLKSVPPHTLREIEEFFKTYSVLEGKRKILKGWSGREAALREIRKAADRHARESSPS